MIASGYTLELYCDMEREHPGGWYDEVYRFPIEFTADGEKCYSEVRRKARREGWTLRKDGSCICPICSKKKLHLKRSVATMTPMIK